MKKLVEHEKKKRVDSSRTSKNKDAPRVCILNLHEENTLYKYNVCGEQGREKLRWSLHGRT